MVTPALRRPSVVVQSLATRGLGAVGRVRGAAEPLGPGDQLGRIQGLLDKQARGERITAQDLVVNHTRTKGNSFQIHMDRDWLGKRFPELMDEARDGKYQAAFFAQFGFNPSEPVGRAAADGYMELARRLAHSDHPAAGVWGLIDGYGSKYQGPDERNRGAFDEMGAAGVQLAVHKGVSGYGDKARDTARQPGVKNRLEDALHNDELGHMDHEKILVFMEPNGRAKLVMGGMGFEQHFLTKQHDSMFEIEGPAVTQVIGNLLARHIWLNQHDGQAMERLRQPGALEWLLQAQREVQGGHEMQPVSNIPCRGRLVQGLERRQATKSLVDLADRCKPGDTLYMVQPYFNLGPPLRAAIRAAKRGVDVKFLVPGEPEGQPVIAQEAFVKGRLSRREVPWLIEKLGLTKAWERRQTWKDHVDLREWKPPEGEPGVEGRTMLHAKYAFRVPADPREEPEASGGSCNADPQSSFWNFESNMRFFGRDVVDELHRKIFGNFERLTPFRDQRRILSRLANALEALAYNPLS